MPDTNISDPYHLMRFIEAQTSEYDQALQEIKAGHKIGHWIWFIFPQWKGLGSSFKSRKYAITCREEAVLYFQHPLLGERLLEITHALLAVEGRTAMDILDHTDMIKVKSCMTLFNVIQEETDVFAKVLDKYYGGAKCSRTLTYLAQEG